MLTKGTMQIQAERIVMRQDADGFQHATATGSPVQLSPEAAIRSRGTRRACGSKAEAQRIEIDEQTGSDRAVRRRARACATGTRCRGNYILYDQRSEFFSVSSGEDTCRRAACAR